jgi:hypothetical protein
MGLPREYRRAAGELIGSAVLKASKGQVATYRFG